MTWLNLHSLLGCLALVLLAWLTSTNRRAIPWKTVGLSLGVLAGLGIIIFWWPAFHSVLLWLNRTVTLLMRASEEGARFLFGPLAAGPGQPGSIGAIVAFQVLPSVVFFSVVTTWLYHIGVLPFVVRWTARAVHRTFRLSGAEALATGSNIFVGIESALMIRPFIERMTRSELMMILTAGLSTIASTVLVFYVSFLKDTFPYIAGHLISASLLSIPAAVIMAKILVPEEETPQTMDQIPPLQEYVKTDHWMGSIIWGANQGVRLAVGIGALLIGMLGLVKLLDILMGGATAWLSGYFFTGEVSLTLKTVLAWLAYPLVVCLGLSPAEWSSAAQLIGERWILTEVIAYQDLAGMVAEGALSPRGLLILSYALCGFIHVASVAIFVGGISALVPARRDDLARLSWLAFWAIAGTFYYGQTGLIG